jgi:hypothetical protein
VTVPSEALSTARIYGEARGLYLLSKYGGMLLSTTKLEFALIRYRPGVRG